MCGIAGVCTFEGIQIDKDILLKMQNHLVHRGPDGSGVYESSNIGLVHNRLAIIDLSNKASQPMVISINDSKIVLAFNGEIYNYKTLRSELIELGHVFLTESDTEVILIGYKQFGEDVWGKLDGFFSLALWDASAEVLYLVRDPLGIKPLYYFESENTIFFASEIKSLLASDSVPTELNPTSISDFFTHFYVPAPRTPFRSILQLEPGKFLKFTRQGSFLQTYWELEVKACSDCKSYEDHEIHLRKEVSIALEASLESDVPVTLLLSSGLDSSILLAELKKIEPLGEPRTLTVGFENKNFDERRQVTRLSRYINFSNNQVVVSDNNVQNFFDFMIWHSDALNANFANIPEYLIFREARSKSKVVLTGMGMDELFAGYSTYKADKLSNFYRSIVPLRLRKIFLYLVNYVPEGRKRYPMKWILTKFLEGSEMDELTRHFYWRTIFSESEKKELFGKNYALFHGHDPFSVHVNHAANLKGAPSEFQRKLYADLKTFCIDNANILMDGLSMAHSVEARPPFLSKRFVEFAYSVPDKMKLRRLTGKYILRKSYSDVLPRFITRRTKVGLVSPIDDLLRKDLLQVLISSIECMTDESLLNKEFVYKLLSEHLLYKKNHGYKLYLILVYLRWRMLFVNEQ